MRRRSFLSLFALAALPRAFPIAPQPFVASGVGKALSLPELISYQDEYNRRMSAMIARLAKPSEVAA